MAFIRSLFMTINNIKQIPVPAKKKNLYMIPKKRSSINTIYGASIGIKTNQTDEIIETLRKGFSFSAFSLLQNELGIPANALASTVNITIRTLARRKQEGKLQTDESERVLRLAKIFDRCKELLEDKQLARQWFKTPKTALNGKTPLEYADTEPGVQEINDILGRLEHGVYF
jgi:putative toxin-antitoxin system antitoxin component (TIGR02293 family)